MRDNTAAILAHPGFSLFTHKSEKWAKLAFPSIRACHEFAKKHARKPDVTGWFHSESWCGLETQSFADFDQTGIATYIRDLVSSTESKMPHRLTRLAEPRAAITGGYWDTPAVLAGIPLAARQRVRAKLPPKSVRLAFFMSAGLNSTEMSKLTAKITRAIWEYTLAGGAVDLKVAYIGLSRATSTGAKGIAIETAVNVSDIAAVALSLSPAMYRTICGPLQTAFSEYDQDPISPPQYCPLPGYLWIGGTLEAAIKAANETIKALQII